MRLRVLRIASVVAAVAGVIFGASALMASHATTTTSTTTRQAPVPPLAVAGTWNDGSSYQLADFSRCEIGDGNLAFVNQGPAVRITGLSLLPTAGRIAKVSTTLLRFPSGATTGEVASTFALTALQAGSVVQPLGHDFQLPADSSVWYFPVFDVSYEKGSYGPITLAGAVVRYTANGRHYALTLHQNVAVSSTKPCVGR